MKRSIIVAILMLLAVVLCVSIYYVYLAGDGPEDAAKERIDLPRSENPSATN